ILNKLAEESTTWPLPVERWSIQTNYVSIFLNRKKSFSSVLSCVLDQKEYYGVCEKNGKEILLTSGTLPSDINEMNLSQLRLHYLRSLVYNLLECNGYTVIHPQERQVSGSVIQIHLALSSSNSALLNRHEECDLPVIASIVATCVSGLCPNSSNNIMFSFHNLE
ncbi:unnamed protein product, partial [Timema podura]|nr:unnamed protein product [Timema podura]